VLVEFCVDFLIIWLLVDYKRRVAHTHAYPGVRDYNGPHSLIARETDKRTRETELMRPKGTVTKAVVKSNSFQQLPFILFLYFGVN